MSRLSWALTLALGITGLLLGIRGFAGPVQIGWAYVNSPLNLASATAVLMLLTVSIRSGDPPLAKAGGRRGEWLAVGIVVVITGLLFAQTLASPFVFDDYVVLVQARDRPLSDIWSAGEAQVAFRPLTNTLFAFQAEFRKSGPLFWHIPGLVLHLLNCVVVFVLARRIARPLSAVLAALLFGVHGTRPEAVSWLTARSDLLATFFVLCALLACAVGRDTRRPWWFAGAALCTALAALSKEIGFVTPLLALVWLALEAGMTKRNAFATAPLFGAAAMVFAYRWVVLGGLGGYVNPLTGQSMFYSMQAIQILKVLVWRAWAILFFPINWSRELPYWLSGALVLMCGGMVVAARGRLNRSRLPWLLVLTGITLVPVLPLALVGQQLWGARVYYLPGLGVALLIAAIIDGLGSTRMRIATVGAFVIFHVAALQQQLQTWQRVSQLAAATCAETAAELRGAGRPGAWIQGTPAQVDGVFFLSNGLPECLAYYGANAHVSTSGRTAKPEPGSMIFEWDPQEERLRRTR